MKSSTHNISFDVTISKNGELFKVVISKGDIVNEMPARSLDEAKQVALASAGGFAQFILGQKL